MAGPDIGSFRSPAFRAAWSAQWRPERASAEVDLIETLYGPLAGRSILDLGCGFGRHALEMARRGAHVVAVDGCAEFLRELDDAARHEGLTIEVVEADVLDPDLSPRSADLALSLGNTISMFDPAQATTMLGVLGRSVRPGGSVVVESWYSPEVVTETHVRPAEVDVGGFRLELAPRLELFPSRIVGPLTVHGPDGIHVLDDDTMYLHSADHLGRGLTSIGLVDLAGYGDTDASPFRPGATRLVVTARRPE